MEFQDQAHPETPEEAKRYTKDDFIAFFNYLTTNTDTFDRVMVEIERKHGQDHRLDPDLVTELVNEFTATL